MAQHPLEIERAIATGLCRKLRHREVSSLDDGSGGCALMKIVVE
jgi:hypothetical protein